MKHVATSNHHQHTHENLDTGNQLTEKILTHPKFKKMAAQKSLIGWGFSAIIFVLYVAFIWVIGTSPELLAQKISTDKVTTLGIYVGIFVIVFSFFITLIYVVLANGKFDKTTQEVIKEVIGEEK